MVDTEESEVEIIGDICISCSGQRFLCPIHNSLTSTEDKDEEEATALSGSLLI